MTTESNYQSQSDREDYEDGVSIPEDFAEVPPTGTRLSRCLAVGSRTSTDVGLLRHRCCCRLVTCEICKSQNGLHVDCGRTIAVYAQAACC